MPESLKKQWGCARIPQKKRDKERERDRREKKNSKKKWGLPESLNKKKEGGQCQNHSKKKWSQSQTPPKKNLQLPKGCPDNCSFFLAVL